MRQRPGRTPGGNRPENKLRVFISYSHEDLPLVRKIVSVIRTENLIPMWDEDFEIGYGFHESIKSFIAHAHVFLPVITEQASARGWVHQEIGYAMALGVPVLPVSFGPLIGQMIEQLQAVRLKNNLDEIRKKLPRSVFDKAVSRSREQGTPLYENAFVDLDRARLLAAYSNAVSQLGYSGCVRQKGALSSFHIPDKDIHHEEWQTRMGTHSRSLGHRQLQLNERLALETHARTSGCRLIINPYLEYTRYGPRGRMARLMVLERFLRAMSNKKAEVVINTRMHNEESLTLVGDWFCAQSVSASMGEGYKQTIFTRHAPTSQKKVDDFDREFDELLLESRWTASSSRVRVIDLLKVEIAKAKREIKTGRQQTGNESLQ